MGRKPLSHGKIPWLILLLYVLLSLPFVPDLLLESAHISSFLRLDHCDGHLRRYNIDIKCGLLLRGANRVDVDSQVSLFDWPVDLTMGCRFDWLDLTQIHHLR